MIYLSVSHSKVFKNIFDLCEVGNLTRIHRCNIIFSAPLQSLESAVSQRQSRSLNITASCLWQEDLGVNYLADPSSPCAAALPASPLDSPLFHPPWPAAVCQRTAGSKTGGRSFLKTVTERLLLNISTSTSYITYQIKKYKSPRCKNVPIWPIRKWLWCEADQRSSSPRRSPKCREFYRHPPVCCHSTVLSCELLSGLLMVIDW